ncbi:MAG TPA: hypothetical protein VNK06_05415 [Thermodesulfobacteriota bacterium]|nr:hypothetical protein [Thermodesulfobacteriota bacterium]
MSKYVKAGLAAPLISSGIVQAVELLPNDKKMSKKKTGAAKVFLAAVK